MKRFCKIYCLIILMLVAGCKKFVQVEPWGDVTTAGKVFSGEATAREAVNGIYIRAMSNNQFILNGGLSIYAGLSADELIRPSFRSDDAQFSDNSLTGNNGIIGINIWRA